jgi:hypothetical protein
MRALETFAGLQARLGCTAAHTGLTRGLSVVPSWDTRPVNSKGHKPTLVARHEGNTNAVKFGVYSDRLLDARASEMASELDKSGTLGLIGNVAVHEVTRCAALLEAIDQDLAERGVVDKKGNARSLLDRRLRVSTRLERWLDRVHSAAESEPLRAERADYIRELQRIALGRDRAARPHDRLNAIKQLLQFGDQATTRYLEWEESDEEIEHRRARWEMERARRKDSLEDDKARIEDAQARRDIDRAQRKEDLQLLKSLHGIG